MEDPPENFHPHNFTWRLLSSLFGRRKRASDWVQLELGQIANTFRYTVTYLSYGENSRASATHAPIIKNYYYYKHPRTTRTLPNLVLNGILRIRGPKDESGFFSWVPLLLLPMPTSMIYCYSEARNRNRIDMLLMLSHRPRNRPFHRGLHSLPLTSLWVICSTLVTDYIILLFIIICEFANYYHPRLTNLGVNQWSVCESEEIGKYTSSFSVSYPSFIHPSQPSLILIALSLVSCRLSMWGFWRLPSS